MPFGVKLVNATLNKDCPVVLQVIRTAVKLPSGASIPVVNVVFAGNALVQVDAL